MKIIEPSYEIITPISKGGVEELKLIEKIGRICYKSEDRITEDSAKEFVHMLIARGHEAMIEHVSVSVKFIVDRGISHELVRHRIASFAQESTRYCNYSKDKFGNELTFIKPNFMSEGSAEYDIWLYGCKQAEALYLDLINEEGRTSQEARSVLPNSIKTEIVVTMNLREWRHFFKLRILKSAHPQMRQVTIPLLAEMQERLPVFFDDIF